jgi:hypothetical protein
MAKLENNRNMRNVGDKIRLATFGTLLLTFAFAAHFNRPAQADVKKNTVTQRDANGSWTVDFNRQVLIREDRPEFPLDLHPHVGCDTISFEKACKNAKHAERIAEFERTMAIARKQATAGR